MAKQSRINVDELVKDALLKIAQAESPVRLSGKGEHPVVFSKANKGAIDKLKDPTAPLVQEVGKGKSLEVKLTLAGFKQIADAIPEDTVGAATRRVAEQLAGDEQVSFIQEILPRVPSAARELDPLLADAVKRQEAEAAQRVEAERRRAERLATSQVAMQRCMEHLAKLRAGHIEELKARLLAAGGSVPEMPEPQPEREVKPANRNRTVAEPATQEDRDFRRDVAERLVSSWRDAVSMKKEEARRFLETALDNISGLRRIGEEQEQVKFDGAVHESFPGVFTDHLVKVVRSGWALEAGDDREYVILKAQVAK